MCHKKKSYKNFLETTELEDKKNLKEYYKHSKDLKLKIMFFGKRQQHFLSDVFQSYYEIIV